MAEHGVTTRIKESIALLQRHGQPVTIDTVEVNLDVGWKDWPPEEALREALRARIRRVLRSEGLVLADEATGERKAFWDAQIPDLEEQLEVKRKNSDYDRIRIKVDEAVIAFLKEKETEFGYAVYPGLFQSDIDRLYRMEGLVPPGVKEAA